MPITVGAETGNPASLDELSGLRALVTGGAGFIGSHIADALLRAGVNVRVLDDLSNGHRANVPRDAEFVLADIAGDDGLDRALEEVDIVFHQAAQINPVRAVEEPLLDFNINALGTVRLLFHAKKKGVRKVVLASTNIYGDMRADAPLAEAVPVLDVPGTLLSPYAASKVASEAYAKVFSENEGFPVVRLRYSNVYGPRQTDASGSGVIAIFARQALQGAPLTIFGDGEQTRDFVHVTDVVRANLMAASSPAASGRAINVGSGIETSIRRVAELVLRLTGSTSPIRFVGRRSADFLHANLDISLAERLTGWRPRLRLEDGINGYVDWVRGELCKSGQ